MYKVTCGFYAKGYIGYTGRCFHKRINEHRKCFIGVHTEHLIEPTHKFDTNLNILDTENKGLKLYLSDIMEINRLERTNFLLNDANVIVQQIFFVK